MSLNHESPKLPENFDYEKLLEDIKSIVKQTIEEVLHENEITLQKQKDETKLWCKSQEAKRILEIRSNSGLQIIRDNAPQNGIEIKKEGGIYLYNVMSLQRYRDNHL